LTTAIIIIAILIFLYFFFLRNNTEVKSVEKNQELTNHNLNEISDLEVIPTYLNIEL
jgi:preprotein translocase subunit YajC